MVHEELLYGLIRRTYQKGIFKSFPPAPSGTPAQPGASGCLGSPCFCSMRRIACASAASMHRMHLHWVNIMHAVTRSKYDVQLQASDRSTTDVSIICCQPDSRPATQQPCENCTCIEEHTSAEATSHTDIRTDLHHLHRASPAQPWEHPPR